MFRLGLFWILCTTCSCMVSCVARSKLVKENEPKENPKDFPSTHTTSN